VVSALTEDGAWEVHITDQGAGMPDPEIQRANSRLAKPPEVDVEVSRRMGLFVVATLAERHDVRVRLRSHDRGGLVATVVVPAELVVEQPAARPEPPPARVPEPEPEPEVGDTLAPPLIPDSTPRVPVEGERGPDWPSDDNDDRYYLEDEQPTERMPAYQEVLSQWFHTGEHWPVSRPHAAAPPPEPEWPVADESEVPAAGRLNGTQLPDERARPVPPRPNQPRPDQRRPRQPTLNPLDPPTLRLEPEAVRGRMARLQDGFSRAREARTGKPDETGD
jgi:hypothetical protein